MLGFVEVLADLSYFVNEIQINNNILAWFKFAGKLVDTFQIDKILYERKSTLEILDFAIKRYPAWEQVSTYF
jgi:hypothetical protein